MPGDLVKCFLLLPWPLERRWGEVQLWQHQGEKRSKMQLPHQALIIRGRIAKDQRCRNFVNPVICQSLSRWERTSLRNSEGIWYWRINKMDGNWILWARSISEQLLVLAQNFWGLDTDQGQNSKMLESLAIQLYTLNCKTLYSCNLWQQLRLKPIYVCLFCLFHYIYMVKVSIFLWG